MCFYERNVSFPHAVDLDDVKFWTWFCMSIATLFRSELYFFDKSWSCNSRQNVNEDIDYNIRELCDDYYEKEMLRFS